MAKDNETVKRCIATESFSTQISQSAEHLGSLSKAFSNAQAKINLQEASAALATAEASLPKIAVSQTIAKPE